MFSYANNAIFAKLISNSTYCNLLRQQSLVISGSKQPFASIFCLRPYINHNESYKLSSFSKEKINVLALDENDKEIGVVKFSRLRSLAVEKRMVVESVNQQAQPHPIYKLVTPKELLQSDNPKSIIKFKTKAKNKKVNIKVLMLKPAITQNDLKVKTTHVLEWLKKKCLVNVKIAIVPGNKKHLEVYEEIVQATSSVGSASKANSNGKEITFEIISSSSIENTLEKLSIEKPLKKSIGKPLVKSIENNTNKSKIVKNIGEKEIQKI